MPKDIIPVVEISIFDLGPETYVAFINKMIAENDPYKYRISGPHLI